MTVWAVAGCLFEVSLPPAASADWRWAGGDGAATGVTLLAQRIEDGRQHFRFRAEVPGRVELRFEYGEGAEAHIVPVRIAPERLD